jgi:hypothetical protein
MKEDKNFINYIKNTAGHTLMNMCILWPQETFFQRHICKLVELFMDEAEVELWKHVREPLRIWIESK